MGRTACTEPRCLYSRAIPLLPLWTVRPVQSLSACTVELYLYSHYGPYGLYRASVPAQGCTLPYLTLQTCEHIDVRTQAEAFVNEMLWATVVLSNETVNGEQRKQHNEEIRIRMLVIKWQRFR
jgi:hypothetical protein